MFVIGVATLASWIPARRAARINPLEALRVE
jgi:ABC-type lipoprotein release transport system permease subunit